MKYNIIKTEINILKTEKMLQLWDKKFGTTERA